MLTFNVDIVGTEALSSPTMDVNNVNVETTLKQHFQRWPMLKMLTFPKFDVG